jgi:streptomycin 6-kinase
MPKMDISEDVTARVIRRFGDAVRSWCDGLPDLLASLAERWGLELGAPFLVGNSSTVFRCVRADGMSAVLKLSPELSVAAEQVAMLRLFEPGGRVPAVLEADVNVGAVLLERIEPGTPVRDLAEPTSATQWAALMRGLHVATVPTSYPRDLRGKCDRFFGLIGRRLSDPAIGRWVSSDDVERGAARCRALLATESTRVLLHGDLHLANVLDGGAARGLVAVDPRACLGDPCFDAVTYLLGGAGLDGVETRCAALAAASGLDESRLLEWCRAIAPVEAILYLNRPGTQPTVAKMLELVR